MAQTGRPNKYFTHVQPRLLEIEKWSLTMTEKQIAQCLGVGYSNFKEYKKTYSDLRDALKKGRDSLVNDLKSVLISRAKGFKYEEIKETIDSDGNKKTEKSVKYALPDVAALNLLLKNYDKDNWANDPQNLAIRKRELELREKQIQQNDW